MRRRDFLTAGCGCLSALIAGITQVHAQFPSGGTKRVVPDLDTIPGCTLSGADARQLQTSGIQLRGSSGFPFLDSVMPQEAALLNRVFGVAAGFAFLEDRHGANAFATPEPLLRGPDGAVLFGVRLLRGEVSSSPVGGNALIAIMAHEWGHILQFEGGASEPDKDNELSADFMAGWYLGLKAASGVPAVDVGTVARSLFNKGDYNFNSPLHHGTPTERVQSMLRGFRLAVNGRVANARQALQESGF